MSRARPEDIRGGAVAGAGGGFGISLGTILLILLIAYLLGGFR